LTKENGGSENQRNGGASKDMEEKEEENGNEEDEVAKETSKPDLEKDEDVEMEQSGHEEDKDGGPKAGDKRKVAPTDDDKDTKKLAKTDKGEKKSAGRPMKTDEPKGKKESSKSNGSRAASGDSVSCRTRSASKN
jgi:hypothetical protein